MPPCVAGDEETFDLDAVNVEHFAVMQQNLFVVDRDLRQLVQAIDHLAAHLAREISVLNLADVQLCIFEKSGAVRLDRTDMVSVLMGNEDVPDGRRVDAQPAHFLRKAVVVIARIDHNGRIALAVEEDVRHPLPHTGHILVDPAGVQGLEDLLAAVHFAHFFFLKFGCFL